MSDKVQSGKGYGKGSLTHLNLAERIGEAILVGRDKVLCVHHHHGHQLPNLILIFALLSRNGTSGGTPARIKKPIF